MTAEAVAAPVAAEDRGYWLDLRSKRDILPVHLTDASCAGYNYYDPLLTPKVGTVDVGPGFDWLQTPHTRSWQLNLHSFRFADFWILNYQATGDAGILERLDEVALDYAARVWDATPAPDGEFIRSDVSVASRAAVYAFLAGRHDAGAFASRDRAALSAALAGHVAWAVDARHYNSNNHGLFNDMHLLLGFANAPAERSLADAAQPVTSRLLSTYLDLQVNAEGVHLEHTPSYALLWVLLGRKIERILARLAHDFPEFAQADARLETTLERVTAMLWWFTKPSGELVNLGDQGRTDAPRWVREQQGEPGVKLLPASGYGFHKDASSYLAFVAAYHATKTGREGYRAASHKQRDELHLLWSEDGQDILIDTGLRGYDFGPERRYTFSKQAHNTLSLDDADYLTDGILEYMDATAPYGGAIEYAAPCLLGSGWTLMAGRDPLLERQGLQHWRLPLLEPGRWLVVCDIVRMPTGGKAEWNFHFAEQWRCTSYGARDATFRRDEQTLRVTRFANGPVSSASGHLHRGDFEPLRGWRFAGDPFAVSNLRFVEWLAGRKVHLRATAFSLGDAANRIEGAGLVRRDGRLVVELALTQGGRRRDVELAMTAPTDLHALLPDRL